jgi:hypothetical protein
MRAQVTTLSAAGNSPWLPVNAKQRVFALSLFGSISTGATLQWDVQYTFDDLGDKLLPKITRSTTTATVILANHGLSVGDSVVVYNAGAPLDGTYDVASVVDDNTFTYTVANSGVTATTPEARIIRLRVIEHADLHDETGRADGNIAFPVTAVRLVVHDYTDGSTTLTVLQSF